MGYYPMLLCVACARYSLLVPICVLLAIHTLVIVITVACVAILCRCRCCCCFGCLQDWLKNVLLLLHSTAAAFPCLPTILSSLISLAKFAALCKCRRESACIYPYRCLANWSHLEYIYIWGGILCGGWGLGVFVFFSFILLYMLT